jgi:hypothetical protein
MKASKRKKIAPRKKKCTCTCGHVTSRKTGAAHKQAAKRKLAKSKLAKRKAAKRKTAKRSGLNGLNGRVFRLSALQKRVLSPALQKAILERQRRLGKTIIT